MSIYRCAHKLAGDRWSAPRETEALSGREGAEHHAFWLATQCGWVRWPVEVATWRAPHVAAEVYLAEAETRVVVRAVDTGRPVNPAGVFGVD